MESPGGRVLAYTTCSHYTLRDRSRGEGKGREGKGRGTGKGKGRGKGWTSVFTILVTEYFSKNFWGRPSQGYPYVKVLRCIDRGIEAYLTAKRS